MPPAFVLSQDQTLHKNYFNNFRCLTLFKKDRFSSIFCVIWTTFKFNVNCQVTSHYSIFKQLSVYSTDRLSNSLDSLTNRSVLFNLAQVWDLSNLVFNFFQTFFISTPPFAFQQIAAWSLIYHGLKICQILFQTFLRFFFSTAVRKFCNFWQRDF